MNYNFSKIIIRSSCLIYLLFACDRINELDVELPFEGEQYVVYGFLTGTDSSYVAIFENKPVLEDFVEFETTNSKFSIRNLSTTLDCISLNGESELFFNADYNTEERYSVVIGLGMETFTSSSILIPQQVMIDSVEVIPYANRDNVDLNVHFTDLPNVDFYSVSYSLYDNGQIIENSVNIPELKDVFNDSESLNSRLVKSLTEVDLSPFLGEVPPLVADSINISLYSLSSEFYEFSKV